LWPRCMADADIIVLVMNVYVFIFFSYLVLHLLPSIFLSFFVFSAPNLSGRTLDSYHTCTHKMKV